MFAHFKRVDEAVFRWKAPEGMCVDSLLSWQPDMARTFQCVLNFVRCDTTTVSPNQIIIIFLSEKQQVHVRYDPAYRIDLDGEHSYVRANKFEGKLMYFQGLLQWCSLRSLSLQQPDQMKTHCLLTSGLQQPGLRWRKPCHHWRSTTLLCRSRNLSKLLQSKLESKHVFVFVQHLV